MKLKKQLLAAGGLLLLAGAATARMAWTRWMAVSLPTVSEGESEPAGPGPGRPGIIYVERKPPSDLESVLRDADAVLVVELHTQVVEERGADRKRQAARSASPMQRMAGVGSPPPSPPPMPRTIYSFTVLDTIKGPFKFLDLVPIERWGGRDEFEDDFPRPGLGERFLVFLKWLPTDKTYAHIDGPFFTYRLENGWAQPVKTVSRDRHTHQEVEFVRELKAIVAKQRGR